MGAPRGLRKPCAQNEAVARCRRSQQAPSHVRQRTDGRRS